MFAFFRLNFRRSQFCSFWDCFKIDFGWFGISFYCEQRPIFTNPKTISIKWFFSFSFLKCLCFGTKKKENRTESHFAHKIPECVRIYLSLSVALCFFNQKYFLKQTSSYTNARINTRAHTVRSVAVHRSLLAEKMAIFSSVQRQFIRLIFPESEKLTTHRIVKIACVCGVMFVCVLQSNWNSISNVWI